MKSVCPGCHKHCKEGEVRCKYGCRYFEKLNSQKAARCPYSAKSCKHKWEAYVTQNGAAWKLFTFSRQAKKALRDQAVTEAELFSVLNNDEKQILSGLLDRLAAKLTEK